MKFTKLEIPDVVLIEPKVFNDDRGFFYESYRSDLFVKNGISMEFVQDNHSCSMKGVLRGLHFQIPPRAQAKLVRVIKGEVFDVVVDIRKKSKTFGRFVSTILSAENKRMLYVPKGFAHGFCVLEDNTEFVYKVSDYYSPQHEHGVIWSDPSVAVPWPKVDLPYKLSDKDKQFPLLQALENYF